MIKHSYKPLVKIILNQTFPWGKKCKQHREKSEEFSNTNNSLKMAINRFNIEYKSKREL